MPVAGGCSFRVGPLRRASTPAYVPGGWIEAADEAVPDADLGDLVRLALANFKSGVPYPNFREGPVRGGLRPGRDGPAAAPDRLERASPGAAGRGAQRGGYCRLAGGELAGGKRTAADLGAWIVFEDESGQGLRPPKGRTWGRRGTTPVVTVTGGSSKRVSLAALIAIKPGCRPRLIYRAHHSRRRGKDQRKGFTETDCAQLLDAARQQLTGPLVVIWDNLSSHVSAAMTELAAARDWLTICQLPPCAHELSPAGLVWSHLKRSLASLATRNLAQLTALVKTRLKRMQYRPALSCLRPAKSG
jgi:hypothetical protein